MYAKIINKDTGKTAITGDYKTLSALIQNAVLVYWANSGRPDMTVIYYSSLESANAFRIDQYNDTGVIT